MNGIVSDVKKREEVEKKNNVMCVQVLSLVLGQRRLPRWPRHVVEKRRGLLPNYPFARPHLSLIVFLFTN